MQDGRQGISQRILLVICVLLVAGAGGYCQAASSEEIELLRKQLEVQQQMILELQKKLDALENKYEATDQKIETQVTKVIEEKNLGTVSKNFDWVKNVKIGGDLRYRHETIDTENANRGWAAGRNRHRIRARLAIDAIVNSEVGLHFRLASGSSDPVSTNQTLDEGFSSKSIWIDRAYFDWHPEKWKGFQLLGGKMGTPFLRVGGNQLMFDGDLSPEGIAAKYSFDVSAKDTVTLVGGGFWAEERVGGVTGTNQSMFGIQGYLEHVFDNGSKLTGGAGYFDWGSLKDKATLYDSQDGFGNSTYTLTADNPATLCCDEEVLGYTYDYDILELFAQYDFKLNEVPMAVYLDYARNLRSGSGSDGTGWLIGTKYNKAKEPNTWELSYDYRELGKDAVVGAFTDSDFIGGGTYGKGHRFGFKYQLHKNWQAGLTYFMNEYGNNDRDYRRLQADLIFKF